MQSRNWPSLLVLAALSCAAIACGIYLLVATSQQLPAIAAAIACLALGQVLAGIFAWSKNVALQDTVRSLARELYAAEENYTQTFVAADLFQTEIAELKRRAGRVENDFKDAQAATRVQFQDLSKRITAETANVQMASPYEAQPAVAAKPAEPREHLNFLLEPIIDISTNATAHYRARFSMTASNGAEIDFAKLVVNADRGGLRPSLDRHVISQAIPLLRRLRAKHPTMKMLIPLGGATLMSADSLAHLTSALAEASDVAPGMVLELSHDVLGKLNNEGIAGLAAVARMGAALALTNAAIGGLDLASLRQLGVKFIGIDAHSFESGFGVAKTWTEFVAVARGLQFQILLTDVTTSVQATSAAQIARLVSGPFFAAPRRVKFNAGLAVNSVFSAAA